MTIQCSFFLVISLDFGPVFLANFSFCRFSAVGDFLNILALYSQASIMERNSLLTHGAWFILILILLMGKCLFRISVNDIWNRHAVILERDLLVAPEQQ